MAQTVVDIKLIDGTHIPSVSESKLKELLATGMVADVGDPYEVLSIEEEEQKKAREGRLGVIKKETPARSALFPYTAQYMAETGEDTGAWYEPPSIGAVQAGLKDIGSLPGRFLTQTFAPETGLGKTSEEYAQEEGNWGKEILTAPSTGWSAALAPVGGALGGTAGGLLSARYAVPVGEALGMAGASTVPTPILDESATAGSIGVEALLNLLGGAAGAGISKLAKKAAIARMRSVLAKEGIENVPESALEDVYSQLTKSGIPMKSKDGWSVDLGSGTVSGASKKALGQTNKTIAGRLDLPEGAAPDLSGLVSPEPKGLLAGLTRSSVLDDVQMSPESVRNAFGSISEDLTDISKTMRLSDAQEQAYQGRLKSALAKYDRIVSKAGKKGTQYEKEAFQRDMLDLLNSVGDIPGASDKLARATSGGYLNSLWDAIRGTTPGIGKAATTGKDKLATAIESAGPQSSLARMYSREASPVTLEHPLAGAARNLVPSVPTAAVLGSRVIAPQGLSYGADWLRKLYEQGENK